MADADPPIGGKRIGTRPNAPIVPALQIQVQTPAPAVQQKPPSTPQNAPQTHPQIELRRYMNRDYYRTLQHASPTDAGKSLLEFFAKSGVKMLAADFDLTMTQHHSGGYVLPDDREHAKKVLESLSKEFNEFATMAQKQFGLRVAVVTFSDQESIGRMEGLAGKNLVQAVLVQNKATFGVEEVYGYFPSNYRKPHSYATLGLDGPMADSKSFHLAKLCRDFNLNPWEIVLIDDTLTNCVAAVSEGYLALHVDSRQGFAYGVVKAP